MWLRKEQGNCSIGNWTWEHDGDVVWVDDQKVVDELLQARNDITEVPAPEVGEVTEDAGEVVADQGNIFGFLPEADEIGESGVVPEGTAAVVTEWVGDDVDRARRALEVELARGAEARSSLVAKLRKLAGE